MHRCTDGGFTNPYRVIWHLYSKYKLVALLEPLAHWVKQMFLARAEDAFLQKQEKRNTSREEEGWQAQEARPWENVTHRSITVWKHFPPLELHTPIMGHWNRDTAAEFSAKRTGT